MTAHKNNLVYKLIAVIVSIALLVGIIFSSRGLSLTAFAASGVSSVGAFDIAGGTNTVDYTYADGILTVLTSTPLTIANTNIGETVADRITIASGVDADVTLAGVNIDVSTTGNCAFQIADDSRGNVTITLADDTTNILKSGDGYAGLQKNGAYISETRRKLTIRGDVNGTGCLEVTGGSNGAGIGSNNDNTTANIVIDGGIIVATGGMNGAGIGGVNDEASYITGVVLRVDGMASV